jgi:hypothetical protein
VSNHSRDLANSRLISSRTSVSTLFPSFGGLVSVIHVTPFAPSGVLLIPGESTNCVMRPCRFLLHFLNRVNWLYSSHYGPELNQEAEEGSVECTNSSEVRNPILFLKMAKGKKQNIRTLTNPTLPRIICTSSRSARVFFARPGSAEDRLGGRDQSGNCA